MAHLILESGSCCADVEVKITATEALGLEYEGLRSKLGAVNLRFPDLTSGFQRLQVLHH